MWVYTLIWLVACGLYPAVFAEEFSVRGDVRSRATAKRTKCGKVVINLCGVDAMLAGLIEKRFEIGAVAFEPGGVNVGQVVCDDLHPGLLGV